MATQYGISSALLRQWRQQGVGPEYFQFTARTVSYCGDYLRDWFNDPQNAELLAEKDLANVDASCPDGRVRRCPLGDDR